MYPDVNTIFNMILNRSDKYELLSSDNVDKESLTFILNIKVGNKVEWKDASAIFRIDENWAIYRESNRLYNFIYLHPGTVVKCKSIVSDSYQLIPIIIG